jgi:hypothetical protein
MKPRLPWMVLWVVVAVLFGGSSTLIWGYRTNSDPASEAS